MIKVYRGLYIEEKCLAETRELYLQAKAASEVGKRARERVRIPLDPLVCGIFAIRT